MSQKFLEDESGDDFKSFPTATNEPSQKDPIPTKVKDNLYEADSEI